MVDNDFTDKEFIDEGGDEEDVDFFASRNDAFEDADDADDGSYSEGVPAMKRKREKGGVTTKTAQAAKRNNKRRHKTKTTINPNSILLCGKGGADGAKGMMMVMPACLPVEVGMDNYALLKNQQRKSPWCMHQSKVVAKKGKCRWDNCPGKLASKAKYPRVSDTHMHCKECSARLGKDIYLCNSYVKRAPVNCHRHYHIYHHNKEFASTMVIN